MTDSSPHPLITLSLNHSSYMGDKPSHTHHPPPELSSTDPWTISHLWPTQSSSLDLVQLQIHLKKKKKKLYTKSSGTKQVFSHLPLVATAAPPCPAPSKLALPWSGSQSQPTLSSSLHPSLPNHRAHTEAVGHVLTEHQNCKSASVPSPPPSTTGEIGPESQGTGPETEWEWMGWTQILDSWLP